MRKWHYIVCNVDTGESTTTTVGIKVAVTCNFANLLRIQKNKWAKMVMPTIPPTTAPTMTPTCVTR